jgi:hypothetical protein
MEVVLLMSAKTWLVLKGEAVLALGNTPIYKAADKITRKSLGRSY